MTATPPRLGTGTKLSYAVGNVGLQMLVAAMSFLLMIFYTDVALVPPARSEERRVGERVYVLV